MLLLKLNYIELIKIFKRPRSYIGFITIGILIPLIMFLIDKFGFDFQQHHFLPFESAFLFQGSLVNGYLISYYLMTVLWVHFPFFIILVAGDSFAGEAAKGTFRIFLTRPVSRFQVITAKFIATYIYTAIIVAFLGFMCLGTGNLILGGGDLFVFDKGILILSQNEALLRFFIGYLLAIFVQMVVASLALFLSTLNDNSVAPIIGTYAIIIVSIILSILKIDALESIKPYLFTTYFDVFFSPFADPIPWSDIFNYLIALGKFIGLFYILSIVSFVRKDILS